MASDPKKDFEHVVFIPDCQYPFIDRAAEAAVMSYVRFAQPDILIALGDFVDFYSLGRYRKKAAPSLRLYLQKEVEVGRAKLKQWARLAPKARRYLIEGNHEARLRNYLEDNAREVFDLADLTPPKLLEAKELGWNWVGPYGAGMWVGKPGGLWVTHGEVARKWSGMSPRANVMEKYGHSVITGHTHRLGSFYHTNALGTVVGLEAGCLCDHATTPRATTQVDWQHGFAAGWVSRKTKRFHVELIPITDGGCIVAGRKYGR